MALNKQKLTSSFISLFGSPDGISGLPDAHIRWTSAYHSYALDEQDVSGDRVVTTNSPGFLSALSLGSSNSALQAAQSFDRAFVAVPDGAKKPMGAHDARDP